MKLKDKLCRKQSKKSKTIALANYIDQTQILRLVNSNQKNLIPFTSLMDLNLWAIN